MLALIALLPLLLSAAASPIHKRYTGYEIRADRDRKCLVAHENPTTGSPVTTEDCATTKGSKLWDINEGSGSIILHGTNLALDAGEHPGNFGKLKVWDSYPTLMQQTWYLTDDRRIAITGGNQCLDEGDQGLQTYQCTTGNTNQIFGVWSPNSGGHPGGPSSTSSAPPDQPTPGNPSTQNYLIHPRGDKTQCVTIQNGYDGVGARVAISSCFGADSPFYQYQKWTTPSTFNKGGSSHIKSAAQNGLCLDAGENPGNGSGVKVWTCYDNLLQQEWKYGGKYLSLSNNQVLDVKSESGPQTGTKPYGSLKDLQTWESAQNDNQWFTFESVN